MNRKDSMADQQGDTTAPEAPPADLAEFLLTVRPGTNVEAAEKLADVVRAVRDTGKAGALTLKIAIVPVKDAEAGVVQVFDKITASIPERDRKGSLAYPDKHDRLTRTPPEAVVLFTDDSIRSLPPQTAQETPKGLPRP